MIVIKIRGSYSEGRKIVRLGNEVVIFENAFRVVQGWSYEKLCKSNKEPLKIYKKNTHVLVP